MQSAMSRPSACASVGRSDIQTRRTAARKCTQKVIGRRQCLLSHAVAFSLLFTAGSSQAAEVGKNKEVDAETSPYIQELLARTEKNREKRRQERLDDYNKRNFRDYFGVEQTARLTPETRAKIQKWLDDNQD
ncbi:hypothetical protein BSKO_01361 [Bryopsis sp. KO-2023]|nr:hypothetical protein BSKO_01361 [Bryopsis sp. KO-2023]